MHRFGEYDVLAKLSASGPSAVYLVRKRGAGRFAHVACLETFRLPTADGLEALEAFVEEATFATQLRHEGCIRVHDVGTNDGISYIAMELVVGETLDDLLRRARAARTPVPFEIVAGIAARIADALHYAHNTTDASGARLDVVHRNLAPSNVMLSYEGAVKVLEFGVARIADHIATVTGSPAGRPAYMAPEQLQGRPVDHRADIFALGVMLHEAFANHARYEGIPTHALALKTYEAPPPIRAIVPELPEALARVTERALASDLRERYADADALANDLHVYLAEVSYRDVTDELSRYLREVYGHHASRKMQAIQALIAGEEDLDALRKVFGATRPTKLDFPDFTDPLGLDEAPVAATVKAPAPVLDEFDDETLALPIQERASTVGTRRTAPSPAARAPRSSAVGIVLAIVIGVGVGVAISLLLTGRFG